MEVDAANALPLFARLRTALRSGSAIQAIREENVERTGDSGRLTYPGDFLNKVVHGDCIELMKSLPDRCVDLVVSDPPYGINYISGYSGRFGPIANDTRPAAKQLWARVVPEFERVMKDNTVAFLSIGWTEMDWVLPLLRRYFTVRSCIVWYKNRFGLGRYTRAQHELNLLCLKGKPRHPRKAPSDVWPIAKVNDLRHSCEKPIALVGRAISTYSERQGVVLDAFLGSGTTAVAARMLDRNFIGFELSAEYCALAERRLKEECAPASWLFRDLR